MHNHAYIIIYTCIIMNISSYIHAPLYKDMYIYIEIGISCDYGNSRPGQQFLSMLLKDSFCALGQLFVSMRCCRYIYIYIYIYIWCRSACGYPPNGMVPQMMPQPLRFACNLQHFWCPASYLHAICSISSIQPRIFQVILQHFWLPAFHMQPFRGPI